MSILALKSQRVVSFSLFHSRSRSRSVQKQFTQNLPFECNDFNQKECYSLLNPRGSIQNGEQIDDRAQSLQLRSLELLMATRSDQLKPLPIMNSHPKTIQQSSFPVDYLIQREKQNQSEQRCKDDEDESSFQFHSQFVTIQQFRPLINLSLRTSSDSQIIDLSSIIENPTSEGVGNQLQFPIFSAAAIHQTLDNNLHQ
jgi:hypothetical protein